MGKTTPRRDGVLLLAASATALGIVAASSSGGSAFWPVVTCVAFALMCVTIHKIGREGNS